MLEPVTPSDCALAITIPLTRDEFLSDLKQSSGKDYAKHIKRSNYQDDWTDEDYWNLIYSALPRVINQICQEVEEYGVTVKRFSSLSEFQHLFSRFKVVTLIAHWRFTKLKLDEIPDVNAFIACLQTADSTVRQLVCKALKQYYPEIGDRNYSLEAFSDEQKRQLIENLNAIISANHALYRTKNSNSKSKPDSELLTIRNLERLTRFALEQAFPQHITASRAIEFSDGLYPVSDLVKSVPETYTGLLDLTVCNSVIAGEIIKFNRPKCLVAVNRYPAQPQVRMAFYKLAIAYLSRRPAPFIDVLTKLHTRNF